MRKFYRILNYPQCPSCNSPQTGFYRVVGDMEEAKNMQHKELKKGNRIQPVFLLASKRGNCFCTDCHYQWHEKERYNWVSREEKMERMNLHGVTSDLIQMEQVLFPGKWKKKEKTKPKKEKKKSRFMPSILEATTGLPIREVKRGFQEAGDWISKQKELYNNRKEEKG